MGKFITEQEVEDLWSRIPEEKRSRYNTCHHFFQAVSEMYSGIFSGVDKDGKPDTSAQFVVRQMYEQMVYDHGFTDDEITRISDKLRSMGWMFVLPHPLENVKAACGVRERSGAVK